VRNVTEASAPHTGSRFSDLTKGPSVAAAGAARFYHFRDTPDARSVAYGAPPSGGQRRTAVRTACAYYLRDIFVCAVSCYSALRRDSIAARD